MKRILILVLTLLLAVGCVIPSFAAEKASSGDWQYTVRNGEAVITGYSGSDTSVSVPSSVGGYSVTEIGTAALYNSEIEKLSIPSTVRKIGWWAFYGSSKLASVKLHPGLQTISFGAFLNCNSLHEIEVPPTVSSIGDDAFAVSCKTRTGIPDTSKDRFVGQQYYTVNHSFVITGFRGTAAYAYAEDNELNFRGDEELSFGDANADGSVDVKDIKVVGFDACKQPVAATHRNFEQLCHAEVELCRKVRDEERVLGFETVFIALIHKVDCAKPEAYRERY